MSYYEDMPTEIPVDEGTSPAVARNPGGHPWRTRRRLMFTVIAFCMACVAWALYKDTDTAVMQAAVTASFGTITAVTGSYVFGAVWEDKR